VRPVLVWLLALLLVAGCSGRADEKALSQARELLSAGRPLEAGQAFEDFIRRHPDSDRLPEALFGLAQATRLGQGEVKEALRIYQRLVDLFPQHRLAPAALEKMVEIYCGKMADWPAAVQALSRLERDYESSTGQGDYYQERIAFAYFMMEDYDQSRRAYQELLERYPDSGFKERAMVGLADTYYVQNNLTQAIAAYQDALKSCPQGQLRERVRFRVANCLEEEGRLKEARQIYRELLKTYDNPEAVRIRLSGVESRLRKGAP